MALSIVLMAAAGLIALATVGWPMGIVAWQVVSSWNQPLGPGTEILTESGGVPRMVIRTLAVSAGVALSATLVALPAGWALRRMTRWGLAMAAVPLMMPGYLAYAAYSTVREGNHPIGRALGGLPSHVQVWISTGLALAGVVLWVWPAAALVLAGGFARVPAEVMEAMRLEGAGRWRRGLAVLGMCRGAVVMGWVLVAVLMLGSAVPLHLAQIQTYAIYAWRLLDLYVEPGVAWRAGLPLLAVVMVVTEVVVRALGRRRDEGGDDVEWGRPRPSGLGWGAGVPALLVWGVSVVVPVVLLALAVREMSLLGRFWHEDGRAVLESAAVAGVVGLIGAGFGVMTWAGLSVGGAGSSRAWRWIARVMLLGALAPGVMIGSATARAWGRLASEWTGGVGGVWEHALLVSAHVARVGALGVLAGWAMWRSEPGWLRDLARLEGGSAWRGWWEGRARPRAGVMIGVGLACAAMSFHEIEASVILQPAGSSSMARRLLEYLHYLKDQQVAAAGVNLLVSGVVVAAAAGWLMSGVRGEAREAA